MWRPAGERARPADGRPDGPLRDRAAGRVRLRHRRRRSRCAPAAAASGALVRPGQLVAWDPSQRPRRQRPRRAALVVAPDDRRGRRPRRARRRRGARRSLPTSRSPSPCSPTPSSRSPFLRLHAALEARALTARARRAARGVAARAGRALLDGAPRARARAARRPGAAPRLDYLADRPERNVGLDELAADAGIGKFRLIRLVPRAHRAAAPRAADRPPHPRRAPPARGRRADRRDRAPRPASPTRATCTATSYGAWASRRARTGAASSNPRASLRRVAPGPVPRPAWSPPTRSGHRR